MFQELCIRFPGPAAGEAVPGVTLYHTLGGAEALIRAGELFAKALPMILPEGWPVGDTRWLQWRIVQWLIHASGGPIPQPATPLHRVYSEYCLPLELHQELDAQLHIALGHAGIDATMAGLLIAYARCDRMQA